MAQAGIDLGGSKTAIGIVEDGRVLDRVVIPSNGLDGPEDWADRVATELAGLQNGHTLTHLGLGIAGQVDPDGFLDLAPNLGWRSVNIRNVLEERTELPTQVMGDVQAIAVGEWLHGAAQGYDNVAAVFLGTGVGGGVIMDGRLRRGAGGSLGEIGHLQVAIHDHGLDCTCGANGCLESFAGGWALEARAEAAIENGAFTELEFGACDAKAVAEAARAGDPLGEHLIETAATALGAGLATILHAYNPEVVVFGGSVATGIPELVDQAIQVANRKSLPAPLGNVRFEHGTLDVDAGILGAAGWAAMAD